MNPLQGVIIYHYVADAQSQSRLDLILRIFEYDTDQMFDVEKVGLAMLHQILSSFQDRQFHYRCPGLVAVRWCILVG